MKKLLLLPLFCMGMSVFAQEIQEFTKIDTTMRVSVFTSADQKEFWLLEDQKIMVVTLFKIKPKRTRKLTSKQIQKAYKKRGLKPSYEAHFAFSYVQPEVMTLYPTLSHWQDDGGMYYLKFDFSKDLSEYVAVYNQKHLVSNDWWFVGVFDYPEN